MYNFLKTFFSKQKFSLKTREDISEEEISLSHFKILKKYSEDDHFSRSFIQHIPSNDLYFYEFKEERYYGNDPQYRTFIPVNNEKEADVINKRDYLEIHAISPRLLHDWRSDDTRIIAWVK